MNKNINAFTFVELIVVITIMAILAAIGFGTYQSYLSGARDSNRLVQLKDIHDGLELYSINSRLPFPEGMIEIQANGNTFAYQGYAGESIIQNIGYDGGGSDIEYGTYLTYMLGDNQRDFQLMTYITDPNVLSYDNMIISTFANTDYASLFPKIIGSPLGILVDNDSNAPLQEVEEITELGLFDIDSGSLEVISYFTDADRVISTDGNTLRRMLPNQSCERILELGKGQGNGKYIINPTGLEKIQVYCDMDTEGGGWTFAGHIDGNTQASEIRFKTGTGVYSSSMIDTGEEYFLAMDDFNHTEMMALINTKNPNSASDNYQFLMLKYGIDAEIFHTDDLTSCSDVFGKQDGFSFKTKIGNSYIYSNVGGCGSIVTLRPFVFNPNSSTESHYEDVPYSLDDAMGFNDIPTGMYLLYFRENSTAGTRWNEDPFKWYAGDWKDATSTTGSAFGNDVWIFIR